MQSPEKVVKKLQAITVYQLNGNCNDKSRQSYNSTAKFIVPFNDLTVIPDIVSSKGRELKKDEDEKNLISNCNGKLEVKAKIEQAVPTYNFSRLHQNF